MAFESKNSDSTSVLVKLSGNPLNYVMSLKVKWLKATGKDLHKGSALTMILNRIPKDVVIKAINDIIEEHKKK